METLPLEDESIEVIVVDNASTQDEATIIEQRYPQITVIRSKENLGFAGGNNLLPRQIPFLYQQRYTAQPSDIRHQPSHQSSGVLSKDWCR